MSRRDSKPFKLKILDELTTGKLNKKRKEYSNQIIEDFKREIQLFNKFEDAMKGVEHTYNPY